jgi:hypothetical protein
VSKLSDRLPMLAVRDDRLPITRSVLDDVVKDGRVAQEHLVEGIIKRLETEVINQDVIEKEARKAIAQQFVSAWANAAVIRFDRTQKSPVYQTDLGFRASFFKVAKEYVSPEAMTVDDFDVMIEKSRTRAANAELDLELLEQFFASARPGLEAGQNLADQFDAGILQIGAASGDTAAAITAETPAAE